MVLIIFASDVINIRHLFIGPLFQPPFTSVNGIKELKMIKIKSLNDISIKCKMYFEIPSKKKHVEH